MILAAAGLIRALGLDPNTCRTCRADPGPSPRTPPDRSPTAGCSRYRRSTARGEPRSLGEYIVPFHKGRWRRMRKSSLSERSIPTLREPSVLPAPLMAERPVVLPPLNQGECRGSDLSRRYCQRDRTSLGTPLSRCSPAGDSTRSDGSGWYLEAVGDDGVHETMGTSIRPKPLTGMLQI
jgi:hypothetical protein